MKQRILPILHAFIILLLPSQSFSSYLVELKSGACFVTDRYWEEDGQIKCNLYGGTTGFDKKTVKSVMETDRPYVFEEKTAEPKSVTGKTVPDLETAAIAREEQNNAVPISDIRNFEKELFLEEKKAIEAEYKSAAIEYRNAKKRPKSTKKLAADKKLKNLNKRKADLIKEIKDRNSGSLPEWWNTSP